ncbi:MAG: hypothetical protein WCT35_07375 [Sideroxydans sp.]|jgi:hypothetical protein
MDNNYLADYFDALERLKKGKPKVVPKGSRINNDTVALEAGRKKGAIKRIRPIFKDLIEAIDNAEVELSKPDDSQKERIKNLKADVDKYRNLWEDALTREVSLIKQLWDEREQWAKEKAALTGEKVTSIFGKKLRGQKSPN